MTESALARKLKLKEGQRAALLNAPGGYVEELRPLPKDLELLTDLEGKFDWAQLFVRSSAELARAIRPIRRALREKSLLWVAFPKATSGIQTDITRDKGWEPMNGADLKWVTLVSINDTWSAFAFRPYRKGEKR